MHELDCPRCGRRPLDEFVFGGERRTAPSPIDDPEARDFDEVWIFENPDGDRDRALVPCRRLPALADGPPRHLGRSGGRGRMTFDGYAGRRLEILRPRPGAVRRRRHRGAAGRRCATSAGRPRSSSPIRGVVRLRGRRSRRRPAARRRRRGRAVRRRRAEPGHRGDRARERGACARSARAVQVMVVAAS